MRVTAPAPAKHAPEAARDAADGGVTLRVVLLATALIALIALAAFYVEVVALAGNFVGSAPSPVPIAVLVLLAAVAGTRRAGWLKLTRRELAVVYTMLLVAVPLGHRVIIFYMLTKAPAYFHMARVNPEWESSFLGYVPGWLVPSSQDAITGLFEGRMAVPWSEWRVPLLAWWLFLLSLVTCASSLLVLLHQHWIEHERLPFPLAQIPLGLITEKNGPGGRVGLPVSRAFWAGLLVAFALRAYSNVSYRVPSLPPLNLDTSLLWRHQASGPLSGLGDVYAVLWPWLIALIYLVPKEVSFSAWFFWLWRMVFTAMVIAAGLSPAGESYQRFLPSSHQALGAATALGLWTIWLSRLHLRRSLLTMLARVRGFNREPEGTLYLWTSLAFVLSFAYLAWFLTASGCRLSFAVILICLLIGYYVVWARVRAEVGVAFLAAPVLALDVMAMPWGYSAFRPAEVVAATTVRWPACTWSDSDQTLAVCPGSLMESLKVAGAVAINKRRLLLALGLGLTVSLIIGSVWALRGLYQFGYFGTAAGSHFLNPQPPTLNGGRDIFLQLTQPSPAASPAEYRAVILGGLVVAGLAALRLRFWWWPLHPVGYLVGNCWGSEMYLVMFAVAWALKVGVIRFGGLHLYQRTIPVATGVIVGDMLNGILWSLIGALGWSHSLL